MTVGENIKEIRLNLGLTLEEFGKLLEPRATKSNVSKWEKDDNKPNDLRIRQIAEIGNVTVNHLLSIPDSDQRLEQILDLTYNLIFTSVNLTVKQKELIAEIRDLASKE